MTRSSARKIAADMAILLSTMCAMMPALAQQSTSFDCLIEPWETVEVSFADQGIVRSLNADISAEVKKGDVLASLDSGLELATVNLRKSRAAMSEDINSAKAAMDFSVRNLKRIRDLYKKKAIPYHRLDEAETEATVVANKLQQAKDNQTLAVLELKIAEQLLARRTVYSPIDGVVIQHYKSAGEYLEDEPVLSLAQMNPLRVHVLIPVALFGKIKVGMRAEVIPEAPLGKRASMAKVLIVDRNVDVASGTFGVQLEYANPEYDVPGGLKCDVNFYEI